MCILGHTWYYDAVTKARREPKSCRKLSCYSSDPCKNCLEKQIIQWFHRHCIRCKKMNEGFIRGGIYTIQHGQLEPDLKAWANIQLE